MTYCRTLVGGYYNLLVLILAATKVTPQREWDVQSTQWLRSAAH